MLKIPSTIQFSDMIKNKIVIILFSIGFLLGNCHRDNPNSVSILLAPYCPSGPNSCKDTLITIEGYLDKINVTTTKFFLWPDKNKEPSISDAFNNSFIEVYYPESDLSKYFSNSTGDYYSVNFDAKVVVHKAKIRVFQRDHPGVDDGNFLTVDSISQIDFYKIESNGSWTKLK
jgi:hypothetical protein